MALDQEDHSGDPHPVTGKKRVMFAVTSGTMDKGTYIRVDLKDFHKFMLREADDGLAEQRAIAEDARIAGVPVEQFTDEDRFYVHVYKRAQKLLNADLFAFRKCLCDVVAFCVYICACRLNNVEAGFSCSA